MTFKKYQHVERFGTSEVEGVELGECYVFPKIDGTNASIWANKDGKICAGSRNRELSLESDNAGFCEWVQQNEDLQKFFKENPCIRLYGEWLVPHSLKTYREEAWRDFYCFDVCKGAGVLLPYNEYQPILEEYSINYIPPLAVLNSPDYDRILTFLERNFFLVQDGKGAGEGIVLKNYGFVNRFGNQIWAKIVTNEFKEKHAKEMGAPNVKAKDMVEVMISEKYVTKALVEKEKSKIELEEDGWSSKYIARLLHTVFYCVVKEEAWNFVKEHKMPTVNFKTLKSCVFQEVKSVCPEIF